jgi:tRNA(Ile)-lysidine synthase
MHFLRGSGVRGLSGMKPKDGRLLRPFLCVSKDDIQHYCEEEGLQPRHDATNDLLDCTRNRVRLELMPQLRQYNPQIVKAICQTASVAAQQQALLAGEAVDFLQEKGKPGKNGYEVPVKSLRQCPVALGQEILYQMIAKVAGSGDGISYRHIEGLMALLQHAHTGKSVSLPQALCASISYGRFILQRRSGKSLILLEQQLSVPGRLAVGEKIIEAACVTTCPEQLDKETAAFDLASLPQPLMVRGRLAGDHMQLEQGQKKIKEIFIDGKVPREERDAVPVVCAGHEIIWLAGIRRSAVALVSSHTKDILLLRIRNKEI